MKENAKRIQGFRTMDPEKQREICSRAGRRAHELGKAYKFDKEAARAAGRLGGLKVSANRLHMAEIGRKGGVACAKVRRGIE